MHNLIYKEELHPSIATSLYNLGKVYYAQGKFDQAKKHSSQALEIISSFKDHPYQNEIQNLIVNVNFREKIGIPHSRYVRNVKPQGTKSIKCDINRFSWQVGRFFRIH